MPEFEIKARIIAETQEDAIRAFVDYWRIFRPDIDLDALPTPSAITYLAVDGSKE